mgnify:FL=1|tara:strand:- start:17163 stop:17792 length:630 start_codon:yes stop_codon:yes gene_type:complete
MKIHCSHTELRKVTELKVHDHSPYIHSKSQINTLTKIITSSGWRNCIVVSSRDNATIVKGRLLYETALSNNWSEVPVEYQNYNSISDEMADMIADNKVTSMSQIDDFALTDVIEKINLLGGDVGNTGYDQDLLDQIVGQFHDEMSLGGEVEFEIDEDESGIKTVKLIYDETDYKKFAKIITKVCEDTDTVPSQLIYNSVLKAYHEDSGS